MSGHGEAHPDPPAPADPLERLIPVLEGALFVYVFGSYGTPSFRPESDIDLAVLFPQPISVERRLTLPADLSARVGHTVDLVDLRTADPIIAMQVLRTGRVVAVKDRHALHLFQMTALSRYQDFKVSRQAVEEAVWGSGVGMSPAFDEDIVLAKVSNVRRCVATIRSLGSEENRSLPDWALQDLRILNLQRAIEACTDLANHLIAANGWELPRDARHAFDVLARSGVIPQPLIKVLHGMVGFRNVAVHDYTALDPAVVRAIVANNLDDFEVYCSAVLDSLRPRPRDD